MKVTVEHKHMQRIPNAYATSFTITTLTMVTSISEPHPDLWGANYQSLTRTNRIIINGTELRNNTRFEIYRNIKHIFTSSVSVTLLTIYKLDKLHMKLSQHGNRQRTEHRKFLNTCQQNNAKRSWRELDYLQGHCCLIRNLLEKILRLSHAHTYTHKNWLVINKHFMSFVIKRNYCDQGTNITCHRGTKSYNHFNV